MVTSTLAQILLDVATQPALLVVVIVVATFVLEDVATVTVALLASQMAVDGPTALAALVLGTALGDLAVFFVARRASHFPLVARLLKRGSLPTLLGWLDRHAVAFLVIARFTPGLRLPVFTAAGSSGMSAILFTGVIVATTLLWTPTLYYAASSAGMVGLDRLGSYGWLLPASFVVIVALAPRIIGAFVAHSARPAVAA